MLLYHTSIKAYTTLSTACDFWVCSHGMGHGMAHGMGHGMACPEINVMHTHNNIPELL